MAATPEGKVKRTTVKYLKSLGPECWYYMPVPSKYGRRTVDIVGIYRSSPFMIENKAPGKDPTKAQDKDMNDFCQAGGTVFIIDSEETLTLFREWIDEHDLS